MAPKKKKTKPQPRSKATSSRGTGKPSSRVTKPKPQQRASPKGPDPGRRETRAMARAKLAAATQEPSSFQGVIPDSAPADGQESSGTSPAQSSTESTSRPEGSQLKPQTSHPEPENLQAKSTTPRPETTVTHPETTNTQTKPSAPENPPAPTAASNENPRYSRRFSKFPSADSKERERWYHDAFEKNPGDGFECRQWRALNTHITMFVGEAFSRICRWNLLDSSTKADLTAIAPKASLFSEDVKGMCMLELFEAWIWRLLWDHLLSPDCMDKWAGEKWSCFGRLHMSLRGGVTDEDNPYNFAYHSSRHSTARMLYMRYGPHTHPDRLMRILWEKVVPVIRINSHPDNNPPRQQPSFENHVELPSDDSDYRDDSLFFRPSDLELKKQLTKLIEQAILTDFYIIGSKYYMKVDINDPSAEGQAAYGFPFRRDLMLISQVGPLRWNNTAAKGRPVDFVRSPLARVYGHHEVSAEDDEGTLMLMDPPIRHYHRCSAKERMRVVVDQYTEAGAEVLKNTVKDFREEEPLSDFMRLQTQIMARRKAMQKETAAAAESSAKEVAKEPARNEAPAA